MSYSFRVVVKNGKASVDHKSPATSTNVPDGDFLVGGHEDEHGRSVTVTRYETGETGGQRYQHIAVQASGYAKRG